MCVCPLHFFSPRGKTFLRHRMAWGHTIFTRRGANIFISREGGANIHKLRRETNIFTQVVEANIYFGGSGGYNDVDEKMHVSKENFLASKANIFVRKVLKLPAEARIFRVL